MVTLQLVLIGFTILNENRSIQVIMATALIKKTMIIETEVEYFLLTLIISFYKQLKELREQTSSLLNHSLMGFLKGVSSCLLNCTPRIGEFTNTLSELK